MECYVTENTRCYLRFVNHIHLPFVKIPLLFVPENDQILYVSVCQQLLQKQRNMAGPEFIPLLDLRMSRMN